MQRTVASLLIALVGLMAMTPLALCPCAQRCREEASATGAAAGAGAHAPQACCSQCAERSRPASAHARGQAPAGAPAKCPCCKLNGGGKALLQPGAEVRAEAPLAVLAAIVLPALGGPVSADLGRPVVCTVDDGPELAPPAVRRAGVVLLI